MSQLMDDLKAWSLVNRANGAGYDAGIQGKAPDINPHDARTDSERRDAWRAGWEQGAEIRVEA